YRCRLRSRLRMSRSRLGLTRWTSLLGLRGLVLSRLVLSRLVLVRASRSRFTLGCLVFGRLTLSGFVLSRFVLVCANRSGFTLGCRSLVWCSRLFGRYRPRTTKLAGLCGRSDCRPPMVHGRQKLVVRTGSMHMLGLHCRCRRVLLVHCCLFRCRRAGYKSALAAVIADVVHCRFVDYGLAVDIGDVRDVHIIYRAVVEEGSVVPISTLIPDTAVAKAVVDAAVEADTLAPVAFVPGKGIAAPTPITGSPEQASSGRLDPCARYPEVAFIAVRPIAGRPQITDRRDHRLLVNRQGGRSDRNRHAELRE